MTCPRQVQYRTAQIAPTSYLAWLIYFVLFFSFSRRTRRTSTLYYFVYFFEMAIGNPPAFLHDYRAQHLPIYIYDDNKQWRNYCYTIYIQRTLQQPLFIVSWNARSRTKLYRRNMLYVYIRVECDGPKQDCRILFYSPGLCVLLYTVSAESFVRVSSRGKARAVCIYI